MENLKLEQIICYPTEIELVTDKEVILVRFDGCQGVFTQKEWCKDKPLCNFDKDDQKKILQALENTCNSNFFAED